MQGAEQTGALVSVERLPNFVGDEKDPSCGRTTELGCSGVCNLCVLLGVLAYFWGHGESHSPRQLKHLGRLELSSKQGSQVRALPGSPCLAGGWSWAARAGS